MVRSVRMLIRREVDTTTEAALLEAWEANIDAGLEAAALGNLDETFTYNWTIPAGAPADTVMELIVRYRQAGWNVSVNGVDPNRYLQFTPNGGWSAYFVEYATL